MTVPFETPLDVWIARATRDLSLASAGQVRTEILEHFESAREAAMCGGVNDTAAPSLCRAPNTADSRLAADINTGGCGCCTGRGSMVTSSAVR